MFGNTPLTHSIILVKTDTYMSCANWPLASIGENSECSLFIEVYCSNQPLMAKRLDIMVLQAFVVALTVN